LNWFPAVDGTDCNGVPEKATKAHIGVEMIKATVRKVKMFFKLDKKN